MRSGYGAICLSVSDINFSNYRQAFLIPRATVDMALQLDSIRHHRQRALPLSSSSVSVVTLVEDVSSRNVRSLHSLATALAVALSG